MNAEHDPRTRLDDIDPKVAASWLRDLSGALGRLEALGQEGNLTATEVAAGWAALIQSVYHRITVRGTEFVSAKLTPHAERHGLALTLPEQVIVPESLWRARPG